MAEHLKFADLKARQKDLGLAETHGDPSPYLFGDYEAGNVNLAIRRKGNTGTLEEAELQDIASSLGIGAKVTTRGEGNDAIFIIKFDDSKVKPEQWENAAAALKDKLEEHNAEAGIPRGHDIMAFRNEPFTMVGKLERQSGIPLIDNHDGTATIAIKMDNTQSDVAMKAFERPYNKRAWVQDYFMDVIERDIGEDGKFKVIINYVQDPEFWPKLDDGHIKEAGSKIRQEMNARPIEQKFKEANPEYVKAVEKKTMKFTSVGDKFVAVLPDNQSAVELVDTLRAMAQDTGYVTEARHRNEAGIFAPFPWDTKWVSAKDLPKIVNDTTVEIPAVFFSNYLHNGYINGIADGKLAVTRSNQEINNKANNFQTMMAEKHAKALVDAATPDIAMLNKTFELRADTVTIDGVAARFVDAKDSSGKVVYALDNKPHYTSTSAQETADKLSKAVGKEGLFTVIKRPDRPANEFAVVASQEDLGKAKPEIYKTNHELARTQQAATSAQKTAESKVVDDLRLLGETFNLREKKVGAVSFRVGTDGAAGTYTTETKYTDEKAAKKDAEKYNKELNLPAGNQFVVTKVKDKEFAVTIAPKQLDNLAGKLREENDKIKRENQPTLGASNNRPGDYIATLDNSPALGGAKWAEKEEQGKFGKFFAAEYKTEAEAKAAADKFNAALKVEAARGFETKKIDDKFYVTTTKEKLDANKDSLATANKAAQDAAGVKPPAAATPPKKGIGGNNEQEDEGNPLGDNMGGLIGGIGGFLMMMMMGFDPLLAVFAALLFAVVGSSLVDKENGFMGGMFPDMFGGKKNEGGGPGQQQEFTHMVATIEKDGKAVPVKDPKTKEEVPNYLFVNKEGKLVTDLKSAAYALSGETTPDKKSFKITSYRPIEGGLIPKEGIAAPEGMQTIAVTEHPQENGTKAYLADMRITDLADSLKKIGANDAKLLQARMEEAKKQGIGAHDFNKDGRLDEKEVKALITNYDANKDGKLTKDELPADKQAQFESIMNNEKNKDPKTNKPLTELESGNLPSQLVGPTKEKVKGIDLGT